MPFKANFHTELFFFCVHKMITSCKYRWQCFILVNAVVFQECQQLVLELFIFPDSQIHTLLYSSSKIVHTVKFFINSGWKQNVLRSSLLVKIIWQCSTLPPPVLKCVILKCTVVLQWIFLILRQQHKIPECPMKVQWQSCRGSKRTGDNGLWGPAEEKSV